MHILNANKGFTLIEIMVVVVILGILAAFVVPQFMDRPDAARVAKVHNDIRAIEAALNMYRLDNYTYPSTEQGLEALVRRPTGQPEPRNWASGGYLQSLPRDPWSNPYQYLNPGIRNSTVDVWSYGRDGRPGGEGIDADIGNWDIEQ